jgi:drug/metabolite transporter (DMT)-like permease
MLSTFAQKYPALGLTIVTVFWGLSFSLMRNWQLRAHEWTGDDPARQAQASLILMVIRMTAGTLVFGTLALRLPRTQAPGWGAGAWVGVFMGIGLFLQLWGLAHTTPALCAFFTGLASLWVPIIAYLLFGKSVALANIAGLVLSLIGGTILVEGGWKLGVGELLTVFASVMFAAQIIALDRLGQNADASRMSAGFFLAIALLSALGVAALTPGIGTYETVSFITNTLTDRWVQLDLVLLIALPTLWGFWWMNLCQPRLDATRAGLIYLLEPVFSTLFSWLIGHDALTVALVAGGGLILLGNAVAEWGVVRKPSDKDLAN